MPSCSHCGLEPGRKPCLAGPAAGLVLAEEMREYDFVGEERGPFKGSGAISVRATDELMLTVGQFNQFGLTELADEPTPEALGN